MFFWCLHAVNRPWTESSARLATIAVLQCHDEELNTEMRSKRKFKTEEVMSK